MESTVIDRDAVNLFDIPNETGTPERRLLLAILERAILDFVGNDNREIQEASEWLFDDYANRERSLFSFGWVCDQLDLDLVKIGAQIKAMPKRGNRKIAPWYITKDYATKVKVAV